MKPLLRPLIFSLLLSFLMLSVTGCHQEKGTTFNVSARDRKAEPPVKEPPKEILASQQAFIEVARKATPMTVNIRADRVESLNGNMGKLFEQFNQFFGDLFPNHPPLQRKEQILGSGFIISSDGYILTNNHVIKGAQKIKVKLADARVFDAKVVGADPRTDVAVLKIDAKQKLPAAVLADSDKLQVGQWALAIGNPFGLGRTLTVGVVSATGRTNLGIEAYEDFIQTDASINPGNSGGPLLNIYGEVVGINTAIVSSGQGIGFAIPINLAKSVAEQLIKTGKVVRGWLGVSIQPLSPALAQSFGLETTEGALVNRVVSGSPAEKAGIRRGDVLLTFNGRKISGPGDLQVLVASAPAGKAVKIGLLRDGKHLSLQVTLAEQKPSESAAASPTTGGQTTSFGLTVAPSKGNQGVRVEKVDPDSPAAGAGVRPGDVILSVNHTDVNDPATFYDAARKAQKSENVVLLLRRGHTTIYLAFPTS